MDPTPVTQGTIPMKHGSLTAILETVQYKALEEIDIEDNPCLEVHYAIILPLKAKELEDSLNLIGNSKSRFNRQIGKALGLPSVLKMAMKEYKSKTIVSCFYVPYKLDTSDSEECQWALMAMDYTKKAKAKAVKYQCYICKMIGN